MKFTGRLNQCKIGLVSLTLFIISSISSGAAIESGQYFSDSLSTNKPSDMSRSYPFFAEPGETVIIRTGHACGDPYPDFVLYNPNSSTADVTQVSANEYQLSITNYGWYQFICSIPAGVSNMSFNVSMLRFPNKPLSYADTDVGTIHSGESLSGTIAVSSDLDAGFFPVSNSCTVQIRTGQICVNLVPNIRLYDPDGTLVTNAFPPEYRAEITARLTGTGIYTVVCSDKFNASGSYALSMVQIPGIHINTSDLDLGTIIPGETLIGTIDKPGDPDIATFTCVTGDTVRLTLSEIDLAFDPVMELYDPDGILLARAADVFQEKAVITNTATTNGTYTVICKDAEDRYNVEYSLTLELLSGPSLNSMPDTPTGISASDGTYADHILVTWTPAGGATGYDLWRTYSTNDYIQLYTNYTSTSYEDYDVITNVVYYYKVRSRNSYGTSGFSANDSGYCGVATVSCIRRALVVGIDHYEPTYGPGDLTGCTNDANGIQNTFLLGDPSNRWLSANVQMLTDRQAAKSTVRSALNSLASSSGAGDLVVYFQSSHGGQSSLTNPTNTYLCTYDANYTDTELAADLALFHSDTRIVVIADSCYSGGLFKYPGIQFEWPFAKRTMAEYRKIKHAQLKVLGIPVPKTLGNNIAFMTACNYDEYSWEYNNHGLYSGFLIEGCTISAVDTNNDGEYQFLELHNYAAANTLQIESTQHAQTYNAALLASTVDRAVGASVVHVAAGLDNDYDGDGSSDLAIYNETTGQWYIFSLQRGWIALDFKWGGPGLMPVTGDYDGDSKADPAVYDTDSGYWYIWSLQSGLIIWEAAWGGAGLTPVAGDYTGDKVADLMVYDKAAGYWYGVTLSAQLIILGTSLTGTGFLPVPGDYNADKASDYALYNESMGCWYIWSAAGSSILRGLCWGGAGYIPVPGDYDGDGTSDLAVYNEYTGQWFIWSQASQATIASGLNWGGQSFTPVPGDYNNDGTFDLAVYHQESGCWFIAPVSGGDPIATGLTFGGPDFIPVKPTW